MSEQDVRQTIIDAVKEMLVSVDDVEKVTVRQIAERAGISIGLINYHFKSKDNLLSMTIGDDMAKKIKDFAKGKANSNVEPTVKLKLLVRELCEIGAKNEKLLRFMIQQEVNSGNFGAPLYLIPLLREIFGDRKDEMQLRIIALQIIQPIQIAVINTASFHMYTGIDITDAEQRDHFIDILIDNVMKKEIEK